MTKAEIIRKLAKKVGVQDLDAKIFFEVFLRKVSLKLNPGETIKIKNFGYFQMRTGKINKTSEGNPAPLLADLIVFYPLLNEQDESFENLIFNIPGKKEEEFNVIDSYFSLSFGKPVIPLKDANKSEYFIPPTGNELRRLFDSKADKLIQEGEVVKSFTKEDEILLIDPDLIDPNQMEMNWDEISTDHDSHDNIIADTDQTTPKESDAFSWDFGDELEKQIEEESLLDIENGDNLFVDYDDLEDISWDFGENLNYNEESPIPVTVRDESKKEPGEFQRVKSSVSDLNIDHKNTLPLDHVSAEDSDLLKSINEELNEEGFAEIKHNPRNYQFEPGIFEKSDNDIGVPENEDKKNEYNSGETINPEPVVEENNYPELKYENHAQLISDTMPVTTPGNLRYSNRKGLGIFVIFALIIVLSGAAFIYLKFINPYYSGSKKVTDAKVSVYNTPSVIIERDYEIPVTYPYPKDSNIVTSFDPIDKSAFEQTENNKNNDSISTNLKDQTNTNVPVKQTAQTNISNNVNSSAVRVKDFIYKLGDKFLVQISAWSSEKNALKHASYLKAKGYQTEIVKANVNSGTWYRVRVINFNSENEAEKFYNKYK